MKSAQFVLAMACAIVSAVLAVVAAWHGHWVWFGLSGLAMVASIVTAWVLAMRLLLPWRGKV
jgi:hypothetical protein